MNWLEIKKSIRESLMSRGLKKPSIRLNALDNVEEIIRRHCPEYISNPCEAFGKIERPDFKALIAKYMAYVTVSSGIGGAILLSHQQNYTLFRTRLAHQIINPQGDICKCGQRGCLAVYTDSKELEKKSGTPLQDIKDETFWKNYVDTLTTGLVNLSWMYPINTIIIGGGITNNSFFDKENIQTKFLEKRKIDGQYLCTLEKSHFGELSPLIGAAVLTIKNDFNIIYS